MLRPVPRRAATGGVMSTLGYAMLQVTRTATLDATAYHGRAAAPSGDLTLALAGWLARASTPLARLGGARRLAGEVLRRTLRGCWPARP